MEKVEDLEFLAKKSSEFIDKQLSAYRQKHANSGTVIAIVTLFIPFFLTGLNDAFFYLRVASVIPIVMFIWAIKLFLNVLETKSMDQGFNPQKFDELANYRDYEKILLFEIGANRDSFNANKIITEKANRCFSNAIKVTLYAVVISIVILVFNNFYKPVKPEKEKITNLNF